MPKYAISDKPLTGTEAGGTLSSYREGDDLYYRIIFGDDGDVHSAPISTESSTLKSKSTISTSATV